MEKPPPSCQLPRAQLPTCVAGVFNRFNKRVRRFVTRLVLFSRNNHMFHVASRRLSAFTQRLHMHLQLASAGPPPLPNLCLKVHPGLTRDSGYQDRPAPCHCGGDQCALLATANEYQNGSFSSNVRRYVGFAQCVQQAIQRRRRRQLEKRSVILSVMTQPFYDWYNWCNPRNVNALYIARALTKQH